MRTAAEIVEFVLSKKPVNCDIERDECLAIASIAMREAIKECHEIAKEAELLLRRAYNKNHDDIGWDVDYQEYIDNNAVLKLIDKTK